MLLKHSTYITTYNKDYEKQIIQKHFGKHTCTAYCSEDFRVTDFLPIKMCKFKIYLTETRPEFHQKIFSISYQEHKGFTLKLQIKLRTKISPFYGKL